MSKIAEGIINPLNMKKAVPCLPVALIEVQLSM
jgi:hypothetical protein